MTGQQDVVLYGAGGHARSIRALLRRTPGFRAIAALDDRPDGQRFLDLPLRHARDLFTGGIACSSVVLAIGDNAVRRKLHARLRAELPALEFPAICAASATVDDDAVLGEGTIVFEQAVVNACAVLGAGCIVNTAGVVEHDCRLGDFASVAPGAVMAGQSALGAGSALGANGTIIDKVRVGDDVVIGAGAAVVRDLAKAGTYVGVPARPLRS